ncbi:putative aspartic proteinase GIP2 [Sesamum angolense]|uniref:Aspartic proteinase GIP2 n=1 Tax=Sesamum angolense TaxID=2727404 RepID=A0AAE2C1M2_9LAMI|nr:putative aspartic proteinase GIP2 [Sesamum angolense]
MASSRCAILLFLAILISASNAQNGLILPIRKDAKTYQFYTTVELGSNRAAITPIIDLGAQYSNATITSPPPTRPSHVVHGHGVVVSEFFGVDTLYAKNQQPVPEYLFSCMESRFMEGLASGANGLVGLARTEISLHKQVANKFNLPDRFSVCLPSSGLGKLSIGGPSSSTLSTISKSLKATPLIVNPVSTAPSYAVGDPSDEYFIDVKSIRVGGETLSVKNSYFSIDKDGVGGTKISTIQNFTAVHNSIYKPLARGFTKAAADMKIRSVAAVEPFRACFSSDSISRTPAGPSVPTVDLVLPGNDIYWRISGANAVVEVNQRTTCLAFVDGGSNPRTSVVIGAHQLEDNFLEFDLVSSQLKFSSSLLVQNQSCSRL